jgi:small GTP-binding protein
MSISKTITILGDPFTGKTTLVNTLKNLHVTTIPTIGVNSQAFEVQPSWGGEMIQISIADVSGDLFSNQEMIALLVPKSAIYLIVFDQSNHQTFEDARTFLTTFAPQNPSSLFYLVSNKSDLSNTVTPRELRSLQEIAHAKFYRISATIEQNVNALFRGLADDLKRFEGITRNPLPQRAESPSPRSVETPQPSEDSSIKPAIINGCFTLGVAILGLITAFVS